MFNWSIPIVTKMILVVLCVATLGLYILPLRIVLCLGGKYWRCVPVSRFLSLAAPLRHHWHMHMHMRSFYVTVVCGVGCCKHLGTGSRVFIKKGLQAWQPFGMFKPPPRHAIPLPMAILSESPVFGLGFPLALIQQPLIPRPHADCRYCPTSEAPTPPPPPTPPRDTNLKLTNSLCC